MADHSVHVTRRRLLGSITTVAGTGAAAGTGTMALFTDSEGTSDNTIETGTLNLELNGDDQEATFFDNATAIKPGYKDSDSVNLLNSGSIDGTLEVVVNDIRNYENGTGHKESRYDDDATGESEGELQNYLWIQPAIDGIPLMNSYVRVADLPATPFQYSTGMTVSADSTNPTIFTIHWDFREGNNNDPNQINETQTDSVELDLTFRLVQGGS